MEGRHRLRGSWECCTRATTGIRRRPIAVGRISDEDAGTAARSRARRCDWASSRRGSGNRVSDIGHAVQTARGEQRFLGGARVRRARDRLEAARGSAGAQLRAARAPRAAGSRHGAGHRADGQRRWTGRVAQRRGRLDRADAGRQPVGAFRVCVAVTETGSRVLGIRTRTA